MKRSYLVTFTIFISGAIYNQAVGQSAKIIPPTPNAMKMTEYQSQRPNLYTGTVNVSIPLYTINFDGWQLPLSVSYNGTGVRPNEEAGEVGLGWALNATGVISRTIRGGDDLYNGGTEGKGYCYNTLPVTFEMGYVDSVDITPPIGSYYDQLAKSDEDTQPDIFNYNFFGYSGSFALSQAISTTTINVIKITQDACKILFDESGKTFTIITPDGYKGKFTIKEKSTSFSGSPTSGEISSKQGWGQNYIDIQQSINDGRFRTISSWYLEKIISPNGQVITFSYFLNPDKSSPYISCSRSYSEVEDVNYLPKAMQTVHEHVYLKRIVSDEVDINFAMALREDIKINTMFTSGSYFPVSLPLQRYTGITVSGVDPASTFDRVISLKQSYFNIGYQDMGSGNQSETELQWLRSKLDRITIDDQEYRFYYENGNKGLPNKLTFGIDHFGFYNGLDSNPILLLPPQPHGTWEYTSTNLSHITLVEAYKQRSERWAIFANGKAGLLTKVKYPTRGYTTFTYEPHSYIPESTGLFNEYPTNNNLAGGARISEIKEYDYNDNLLMSKSYKYIENPTDLQSPSTGKLMTPLHNRYARIMPGPNPPSTRYVDFKRKSFSTIPGNNSAEGKIIGYAKVHEIVTGGSESHRTTYFFENRPNKVLGNNLVAVGYPNLNGQSKEVRVYNDQGSVIQQTENLDAYHVVDSIKAIMYEPDPDNSTYINFYAKYSIQRTFITPYKVITTTLNQTGTTTEDAVAKITYNGSILQTEKKFSFNTDYLLSYERSKDSKGDSIVNRIRRPSDYSTPSTALQRMKHDTVNIVNTVIEEITYRNGNVIAANGNKYQYDSPNNKINMVSSYSYNPALGQFQLSSDGSTFPSIYEKKVDFELYHAVSGKLLQYTASDGVTNSFVWGHNNSLPIVHGLGVGYNALLTAHNNASTNPSTYESTLRNDPNLVGKQVTTFVHNPLVGLSKTTSPSEMHKSYEYDQFGRLKLVRDTKENIVAKNAYHFITLPITRTISLSGSNFDFGSFYNCNLPGTRTLTISNLGEDDLEVYTFTMPAGFSSSWMGGVIPAGSSANMIITFTGSPGTQYNTTVSISSNATNSSSPIPVTLIANYNASGVNRTIQLSPGSLTFSTPFNNQNVTVSNVGNECFTITGTSLALNDLDWAASIPTVTLAPGESTTMQVMMKRSNPSPTSNSFSVLSNKNGGNATLTVSKQ